MSVDRIGGDVPHLGRSRGIGVGDFRVAPSVGVETGVGRVGHFESDYWLMFIDAGRATATIAPYRRDELERLHQHIGETLDAGNNAGKEGA